MSNCGIVILDRHIAILQRNRYHSSIDIFQKKKFLKTGNYQKEGQGPLKSIWATKY